ncbi:brorin-like [Protopterus annectens]|uniref:brorin-like n=1 Tax=Protopterus annectens TaxID=7888 RepID=UPI001CFA281B|nr:brorin-like [Protopterus annectens]
MQYHSVACMHVLYLLWGFLSWFSAAFYIDINTEEYGDYDMTDYRGKWCIGESGTVYNIGDTFYPSPSACPCICTEDGPLCIKPSCPRIHPKCIRFSYQSCCPKCEALSSVCEYDGKTYQLMEEFMPSPCERCRCESNRAIYCTVTECPSVQCVNPVYEPEKCCPVCKNGPNCYAGSVIIPAGMTVKTGERTICFCTYEDGTWYIQPQALCIKQQRDVSSGKQLITNFF